MNDAAFGRAMENVRKNRNIKLVTTERRKKLFSVRTKLSYYKNFHRKFISKKMRKTQMIMNKPLDLSNVCMNFGTSM